MIRKRPYISASPAMVRLSEALEPIAMTDLPIILFGETGVGKTHLVEDIHRMSPAFEKGPLVTMNSRQFVETLIESELFGHVKGAFTGAHKDKIGLLERASGGTLFIDEVAQLPKSIQIKLLSFLETGEFCPVGSSEIRRIEMPRIIVATNEPIPNSTFREDLYYRLAGDVFTIPSLRERPEDIKAIAEYERVAWNRENKTNIELDPSAIDVLTNYRWPGNIREFSMTIKRSLALAAGETLYASDIKFLGKTAAGQTAQELRSLHAEHKVVRVQETDPEKIKTGIKTIGNELLSLMSSPLSTAPTVTTIGNELGLSRQTVSTILFATGRPVGLEKVADFQFKLNEYFRKQDFNSEYLNQLLNKTEELFEAHKNLAVIRSGNSR